MLTVLLLLAAFIFFLLTFVGVTSRFSLLGAGLACWVLVPLIDAASRL